MNDKVKLYHTLTRYDPETHKPWLGLTGHIDYEMLKKCGFPAPQKDVLILTCGPKGFNSSNRNMLLLKGYEHGEHYL